GALWGTSALHGSLPGEVSAPKCAPRAAIGREGARAIVGATADRYGSAAGVAAGRALGGGVGGAKRGDHRVRGHHAGAELAERVLLDLELLGGRRGRVLVHRIVHGFLFLPPPTSVERALEEEDRRARRGVAKKDRSSAAHRPVRSSPAAVAPLRCAGSTRQPAAAAGRAA